MNLKGKQTYNASAKLIWDILMDVDKLTKITPGVSKLEKTGEDQYKAISEVKIGPVKGAFKGDLSLQDKKEPSQFVLKVKQLSKIGNADATVQININELENGQSELSFDGKAKLSGTLARTGQRVLTGVANSLTKQFFAALGDEINSQLATSTESSSTTSSDDSPVETVQQVQPFVEKNMNDHSVINENPDPTPSQPQSSGFIAWLKRLFGLK